MIKDQYTVKVLHSISANTYTSWAAALTAMETEYAKYSGKKERLALRYNDNNILNYSEKKQFVCLLVSTTNDKAKILSMKLDTHKFEDVVFNTSNNSITTSDYSNASQNNKLELILR